MMKRLLWFLLLPIALFGQGARFDTSQSPVIINQGGTPATGLMAGSNATITVCTAAGAGIPCTPLATIYSDLALTVPKANPFQADANGNYFFTAAAATTYFITVQFGVSTSYSFYWTAPYLTAPTNGSCFLDGIVFVQSAAGINSAFAGGCTDLYVPIAANILSDAVITIAKGSFLHFQGAPGIVYTVAGIRLTDSTTDYTGTGGIDCTGNATIKLANTKNVDLISQVNFGTLTGTTNQYGLSRAKITGGCIFDGNKANNSTGWVMRLYGRGTLLNATVQNGAQGGAWLEQHDASSFTNPPDDDMQTSNVLRAIDNGGDGVNIPQGQGWKFDSITAWGNSGWGIEAAAPLNISYLNNYLNTLGACRIKSGGGIFATNAVCTTSTGNGLQMDTGAGASNISTGSFASISGTGLSVGNVQNTSISGLVQNSNGTSPAFVMNGGSGDYFNLTFFNNQGVHINFASGGADSTYIFTGSAGAGTCTSGTVPTAATIFMDIAALSGCNNFVQFRSGTLNASGWAPKLPTSNGTMFSTGNTDGVFATAIPGGCTTGNTVGSNCSTDITITWTTPFADTSYTVSCTGLGIVSGVPSGPYVVSQTASVIHVNYFAITAVAAAYSNVFCTASHR